MAKGKKLFVRIVIIFVVVIAVLAAGMWLYTSNTVNAAGDRILSNISTAGVDIGDMTVNEAAEALEKKIADSASNDLIFKTGKKTTRHDWGSLDIDYNIDETTDAAYDIGRSGNILSRFLTVWKINNGEEYDMPLSLDFPKGSIRKVIKDDSPDLNTIVREPRIAQRNGKAVVVDEAAGHKIRYKRSVAKVKNAVEADWDGSDIAVRLVSKVEKPKYTAKDLKNCTDVMGTYSTNYKYSTYNRCLNIANGADKIDGIILAPGETFSAHDVLAPFSADNGYYTATTIVGDEHIDDYGGGVCQVTTTLYNAVIRAELKIKERYSHSQTISYAPLSADAAIAGTSKDLKFTNDTDDLIYLSGSTGGHYVTFTVYGNDQRPSGRSVSFETVVLSSTSPTEKIVERDPNLPKGEKKIETYGSTGYSAQLWKIVTVNGKIKKRYHFNSSSYRMVPEEIILGTGKNVTNDKEKKNKNNGIDD